MIVERILILYYRLVYLELAYNELSAFCSQYNILIGVFHIAYEDILSSRRGCDFCDIVDFDGLSRRLY